MTSGHRISGEALNHFTDSPHLLTRIDFRNLIGTCSRDKFGRRLHDRNYEYFTSPSRLLPLGNELTPELAFFEEMSGITIKMNVLHLLIRMTPASNSLVTGTEVSEVIHVAAFVNDSDGTHKTANGPYIMSWRSYPTLIVPCQIRDDSTHPSYGDKNILRLNQDYGSQTFYILISFSQEINWF
ncbi:hypothetical protein J6590_011679 [Homalodisca vitripennis]|nr:hypothetical protein J6590_011679 [Homalodisca vitripennis]